MILIRFLEGVNVLSNIYMIVMGLFTFGVGTIWTAYFLHYQRKLRTSNFGAYVECGCLMLAVCIISPFGGFVVPCILLCFLMMLPVYLISKVFDSITINDLKTKIKEIL